MRLDHSNDALIDIGLSRLESESAEWAIEDAQSYLADHFDAFDQYVLQEFAQLTPEEEQNYGEAMHGLFTAMTPEQMLARAEQIKQSHQRLYDKAVNRIITRRNSHE